METPTYSDYATDIAAEGLAYLLAKKIMKKNTLQDGVEKDHIAQEVAMLQREQGIIYGRGTREEFHAVMKKIKTIYNPIIKDAIVGNTGIGTLPAE
jgi:hypothetical protein